MNLSRRPFFLVTFLVFGGLALLFFGLYQREVEKDLLPSGTEVIGSIVNAEFDVARRSNARLLWSKIENQSILYRKDTIRTGPGSKVLVKLSNNSSIALGENTLVVLETENESLSLRLADGDIEFSGNVTVSLDGNTKLRAVDGTLRLKRDSSSGKDKVAAVSGKAEVVSDGNISLVEQGEVLIKGQTGAFKMSAESIQEAGLSDLGLNKIGVFENSNTQLLEKLSQLNPNAKMVQSSKQTVLRISWQPPAEASMYQVRLGEKEYKVTEPFLDVVPQDMVAHLNEKITVRASGAGVDGLEQSVMMDTPTKDLTIALGSTPQNKIPFDESRVILQKKKIKLVWSDLELRHQDFLHYNVRVQHPKGRIETLKSTSSNLTFEFQDSGSYEWNVQAVFKDFGFGQASKSTNFNVIGGATLSAPSINPASEEN